jgi:hypothetical protein
MCICDVEEPGSTLLGRKYDSASILMIAGIGEPGRQSIVMEDNSGALKDDSSGALTGRRRARGGM